MKSEYLFSYGTLQNKEVQLKLFGRLLKGKKDKLSGYRLQETEITDAAFLNKGEEKIQLTLIVSLYSKDIIEGIVFELTTDELIRADKYEPVNYQRKEVKLKSGQIAWIYLIL